MSVRLPQTTPITVPLRQRHFWATAHLLDCRYFQWAFSLKDEPFPHMTSSTDSPGFLAEQFGLNPFTPGFLRLSINPNMYEIGQHWRWRLCSLQSVYKAHQVSLLINHYHMYTLQGIFTANGKEHRYGVHKKFKFFVPFFLFIIMSGF